MISLLPNFETTYVDKLMETLNSPSTYLNHVFTTAIIFVIFVTLTLFSIKKINKSSKNIMAKKRIQKRVRVGLFVLLILSLLVVWVNALNALILTLIVLSLFFTVLVKGTLDNLIAWFIIRNRRYFKVNQRIEMNDKVGRVVSIGFFHFELAEIKNWLSSEQLTGRSIKIPNKEIFDHELFTYNSINELIWKEISYTICHNNDWQDAKRIMLEVVDNYYNELLFRDGDQHVYEELEVDINPKFNLSVEEKGIVVYCQFLVNYESVAKIQTSLHEQILKQFNEHPNIDFAALDIKLVN